MKVIHTVYGSTGIKLATITKDDHLPTTQGDNTKFLISLALLYNIPFVFKGDEVIFTHSDIHKTKNLITTTIEK